MVLDNDSPYNGHCQAPSCAEVGRARPARGTGAPSRTNSHYDRILALLRERGPTGVISSELYDAPHLFGRSPGNRISEMRQAGHLIETSAAGESTVRYVLLRDSSGAKPFADSPDWYERQTGKPRPQKPSPDFGPLFEAVQR